MYKGYDYCELLPAFGKAYIDDIEFPDANVVMIEEYIADNFTSKTAKEVRKFVLALEYKCATISRDKSRQWTKMLAIEDDANFLFAFHQVVKDAWS